MGVKNMLTKENEIIEIKGYVDSQVRQKMESCPNLKILYKKDLEEEFKYVINTKCRLATGAIPSARSVCQPL